MHLHSFVEVYPCVFPEFSISNCRKLYFSKISIIFICYSYIKSEDLTSPSKVFPGGSVGKESTCQFRRHKRCGFDPWVRKIPWKRKWQPTPVNSCLENSTDSGPWWTTVHGVAQSWAQLSEAEVSPKCCGYRGGNLGLHCNLGKLPCGNYIW